MQNTIHTHTGGDFDPLQFWDGKIGGTKKILLITGENGELKNDIFFWRRPPKFFENLLIFSTVLTKLRQFGSGALLEV